MRSPTHVYLGIQDGICITMFADNGDFDTAEAAADVIRWGGHIERVSSSTPGTVLGKPWPAPPVPGEACEAAARSVA